MNDDIDITADLQGGADDANLADSFGHVQAPLGAQPAHGDAVPADQRPNNPAPKQQPAEPKAGDENLSIRDQLTKLYMPGDEKPAEQQQVQQPAAEAPVLTKDAEGKYRNTDGTFASAEQITAFEAAAAAPAAPDPAEQARTSALYAGMTPAEQQQFQSLPAELRTLYERRTEDLNTRAARYGEYDQIERDLIGPRRAFLAQHGNNPYGAINGLLQLSDFAARDPGAYVLWFAQQQGLDLDALLDAQEQQHANVDPTVRQLQGTVQQLQQQLNTQTTAAQQAAHQDNVNYVAQFCEAKDAAGNLLRPYMADITNDWHAQIAAVRAANPQMDRGEVLQKAYDNAVWANPATRAKMQESLTSQQQQAQQQQVQQAKAAGSSVTGAPAGSTASQPNNSNLSLRDMLQSQFDAARAV